MIGISGGNPEFDKKIKINNYKKYCMKIESKNGLVDFPLLIKDKTKNVVIEVLHIY